MSNTIVGDVHFIDVTKSYGSSGFRKRLVVISQQNGSYINYIPCSFLKDDCDKADKLKVGDKIKVEYRLNGRKWQKDPESEVRYFVDVEVVSFLTRSEPENKQEVQDDDIPF